MLTIWRNHFNSLINVEARTEEVEPEITITDDEAEIPPTVLQKIFGTILPKRMVTCR